MSNYKIRVEVFTHSIYGSLFDDQNYNDDKVSDVQAWLTSTLDAVPEEYRADARMEIESVSGYEGEHRAEVTIYYLRPETAGETSEREARDRRRAEERENHERTVLASLKQKYEAD